MKKRVYVETTIVSYLTARPSGQLVQAARQHITLQWWENRRSDFDLYTSQYVVDEAAKGDADAARRRLETLEGIATLTTTEAVTDLAESLVKNALLPVRAATDALHIAIATVHKMDILLTWNCAHLANAEVLPDILHFLRSQGYEPPIICTPDELMGE